MNGWAIALVIFCAAIFVTACGMAIGAAGNREDSKMFRDNGIPEGFDMKNIQPDMDFGKQTRKATNFVLRHLQAGDDQKACYAMHLMNQMLDSIKQGQPQPWSHFLPMFNEEFDCV